MAAKRARKSKQDVPGLYSWADRRRLSGETLIDLRTILKWERGEHVRDSVGHALEKAAKKLKLALPGGWVKRTAPAKTVAS